MDASGNPALDSDRLQNADDLSMRIALVLIFREGNLRL